MLITFEMEKSSIGFCRLNCSGSISSSCSCSPGRASDSGVTDSPLGATGTRTWLLAAMARTLLEPLLLEVGEGARAVAV